MKPLKVVKLSLLDDPAEAEWFPLGFVRPGRAELQAGVALSIVQVEKGKSNETGLLERGWCCFSMPAEPFD